MVVERKREEGVVKRLEARVEVERTHDGLAGCLYQLGRDIRGMIGSRSLMFLLSSDEAMWFVFWRAWTAEQFGWNASVPPVA